MRSCRSQSKRCAMERRRPRMPSQRHDPRRGLFLGLGFAAIAQWQREGCSLDLEDVAGLRFEPIGKARGGGAEEMHVYVTGAAEQRIFEVVMLEVGDGVRHVAFAGQEWLLPRDVGSAPDAAPAADVRGQVA